MPTLQRPRSFAHVVYRTYRFDDMIAWYCAVFDAKVQHSDPVLAFLTYDEEHHRVALLNLAVVKPLDSSGPPPAERRVVGVDHVAYGIASLTTLLENYEHLKSKDILPYWSIHHGITVSLYYADPDGNQMEFQVDSFGSVDEANDFMRGVHFATNSIGVEFDPDAMLAALRAGKSEASLLRRKTDLPVPEVKGSIAA